MDGNLGEFRPTFAQLAAKAGVPIVPVAIDGTYEVLPRNRHFPSFGKTVKVTFLPPLMPKDEEESTVEKLCADTKEAIRKSLAAK